MGLANNRVHKKGLNYSAQRTRIECGITADSRMQQELRKTRNEGYKGNAKGEKWYERVLRGELSDHAATTTAWGFVGVSVLAVASSRSTTSGDRWTTSLLFPVVLANLAN